MKNPLTLAIDQGTNSTRGILFDRSGKTVFTSSKSIKINRIDHEKVEQDPYEILESLKHVVSASFDGIPAGYEIKQIGIATQRSSLLAMDNTGRSLSQVISWQDRRTIDEISKYEGSEQSIKKITGLPLSPHYGATKFRWLLENNEEVKTAADNHDLLLSPLISFLLFHMLDTPAFLCDHANAHRTLLMSLLDCNWDDSLLNIFNIRKDYLPLLMPITSRYGTIRGVPVTAVSGDQNSAVFSEGNLPEKSVLINAGTGAFIIKPTGSNLIYHPGLLSGILAGVQEGSSYKISYSLEGTVNGAASAIEWAKKAMGIDYDIDLNNYLNDDPNQVLFFNTVGGLGSPFWKSGTEPGWETRPQSISAAFSSVVESIVFLIKINFDEISRSGPVENIFLSGGVSTLTWFCQQLANHTGIRVSRLENSEATARGVAYLASHMPFEWKKNTMDVFFPVPPDKITIERFGRFKKYLQSIINS